MSVLLVKQLVDKVLF